jgi:predicted phage terminase large subunit-like protein
MPALKTKFQKAPKTTPKSAPAPKGKPETFREFIKRVDPRYRFYKHCDKLIDRLQDVADGKIKRLMIFMPPRHGKSRTATQLFPAYFLSRYPRWWTSISSYAADLAYTHSRLARDLYKESGGVCRDDTDAVKQWAVQEGGGLFASGVGGPLTGKGFMLGIIDDPLKNSEQASSQTIRDKQKEWYESTFYTREEPWSETDPNGAIVVIMTRWHDDDLAGWLLKQEMDEDSDSHESWHIVCMEAIKSETSYRIPETCTLEPDWRATGEALCPERRPLEKLKRIAKKIGSYFFDALFQQSPKPQSGNIIQEEWFKPFRAAPKPDRIIISADTANKVSDLAAYTVFGVWFVTASGYYLVEVVRERINAPQRRRRAINLHAKWKSTAFLIEDKASGIDLIQYLKEDTNIPVIAIEPPPVDKVIRLSNESPAIESGRVFLPLDGSYDLNGQAVNCNWVHDYIQELTSIPFSSFLDQGDMTSQFLAYVREHGGKTAMDYL